MFTNERLTAGKLLLPILLMIGVGLGMQSCKKDLNEKPDEPEVPGKFYVTDVVSADNSLGLLINDPMSNNQYATFGHKDSTGLLDSISVIIVKQPGSDEWLAHEVSSDYVPQRTTTSTGQTIGYHNLDPVGKTGTIVVKDTKSGNEIYRGSGLKLPQSLFDGIQEARRLGTKGSNNSFGPNWRAEATYILTAGFGCAMGVGGIAMGGPIATLWAGYNTYQNCKATADAIGNLMKGEPAFGCISTSDNLNAISGFAETFANGLNMESFAMSIMPAAINYGVQQSVAGSCKEEPKDPLDEGGGHGDPHLYTPDGYFYDFQGYGEFIAVKAATGNFEIQVRQESIIPSLQATFNTAIAVQTGSDVVCVTAGPQNIYINNTLRAPDFQTLPLNNGASLALTTEKGYPVLTITTQQNDRIKVRMNNGYKGTHIDYTVQLAPVRAGKVIGLLGNYDGNPANDLVLRNGQPVQLSFTSLYPTFADSWRIQQATSLFYYAPGKNTASYTKPAFPQTPMEITTAKKEWARNICQAAGVNGEPSLSNCILDVAATSDESLATAAAWAMKNYQANEAPFNMDDIELQGDATLTDNLIRLTRAKVYLSGQAFYTKPFTAGFETEFTFRIPPVGNGGADGITLLIAKEKPNLTSNAYPGSAGKLGYQGVPNSLAIEFDTQTDGGENSNHLAIHTKGTEPNSTHYTARVATKDDLPDFNDGAFHTVKIRYITNKITVYFDDVLALQYTVDLSALLGLNGQYYIGLTSSTSSSFEQHDITKWTVKPL
ncbi:MAG: VWD domain-containing protein [Niastella sp.]|nr:VWD domain-containing protein [Niastella sp.]